MPRPIFAEIHPNAVKRNLELVKQKTTGARVWAVVKADAYGHGIERIYTALEAADGIALLDLNEAVRVRELGWTKPILLLEGIFTAQDVQVADQYRLTTTVHCDEQLALLSNSRLARPIDIYLKMNTGMNRLGFAPNAFRTAWERARECANIGEITLMNHFANADEGEVDWQMDRFDAVTTGMPGQRSLANSASVLWHPRTHRDWVRPGIILYGASPTGLAVHIAGEPLEASMTLRSEVIGIQTLQEGDTVGYGRTFTASHAMRIGVVACGYADGYPRHAQTGTPIAVDGIETRVVGRISMDMLTVDLSPIPAAHVGSCVELWGTQIRIDDVASSAGTIGYELMCALARRVPAGVV